MRTLLLFCLTACLTLASHGLRAQILADSAGGLRLAVERTPAGGEVTLAEGRYDIADLKLPRDITLKGRGDVVIFSTTPTAKGLLNTLPGASLRVENITFMAAKSPDKNGAGIRHDGFDLTIINCEFGQNENGVLATGDAGGRIIISGSRFLKNGHGDGYSHGVYVVRAASLDISNNKFIGTKIGHHVKSLAAVTHITSSSFHDHEGRSSYVVDASKGGDVTITNNTIVQTADSDNPAIFNYDLTRGGKAIALTITGNRIINRHPRGRLLRNATKLTPVISGNEITNDGGGRLDYQQTQSSAPRKAATQTIPAPSLKNKNSELATEHDAEPALGTAPTLSIKQPSPKAPQKTGTLRAPKFDRATPALAHFKLQNNWRKSAGQDYLTFGQAFSIGALQPGDAIAARFGETQLPAQLDVKALHEDGSVRHGAVTITTPPLGKGKTIDGAIVTSTTAPVGLFNAKAAIEAHYNFPLSLNFYYADGSTKDFSTNARTLVLNTLGKKTDIWLDGPLVKEWRVEKTAARHLILRFDIRAYRDGDIRTSVTFSNEKTFSPGRRESVYDVRIGSAERLAFSAEKVSHHRSSTWRRIFWTGAQPKLHIIHDLAGLIDAKAIAPLDPSPGASASTVFERNEMLAKLPPLSPALIMRYFPTTGGRPDIGLYPQWTSHYLVAQTEPAKRIMLANAEAAGAVPWHFIDEQTAAPISIEVRRKFWADERGLESQYSPDRPHPNIFESSDGGWSPDHAHKPALTAVPYLVTADRYYADELAMQAAFAIFGRWPHLREGGVKAIDVEQVRASAWSLRDLSDAAYLLPDSNRSKAYLERALNTNLGLMKAKYIDRRKFKSAGELEGFFEELIEREPERLSPWQNDYMVLSLWLAAQRGNKDAAALMAWSENFHTGRFLNPGFNIKYAAAYQFPAKDAQSQIPVASWAVLAAKIRNSGAAIPAVMEGYTDLANGYIGSAYAALTAIASSTGSATSFEALARLMRESKDYPMWTPLPGGGVRNNNNFLFTVMIPNGAVTSRDDIRWRKDGGAGNDFIIGASKADKLDGGGGADALFGFEGDDVLSGDDGADLISGGAGDDTLSGGSGGDIFAYALANNGADRITDFNPADDLFQISKRLALTPAAARNAAVQTTDGALITLGRDTITLSGVSVTALTEEHFRIIP